MIWEEGGEFAILTNEMDIFRPGACLPAAGACLPAAGACLPAAGACLPAAGASLPAAGACLPAAGVCLPVSAGFQALPLPRRRNVSWRSINN